MGIMSAITTTTIVITTKANPTGTTTAPTARRSTCICELMPVSELSGMVQAAVNFKAQCEREIRMARGSWQRLVQLAQLRYASLTVHLHIQIHTIRIE